MTTLARAPARIAWTNALVLGSVHVAAAGAVAYMAAVRFSWWTVGLAFVWFVASGLSVTGGYHRLFAHRSYRASAWLRGVYLLFGAAAVQNTALKWAADHRRHHMHTDGPEDPYSIRRGFWWAHIGWVVSTREPDFSGVSDLEADRLVRWQARHYVALALLMNVVVPAALGALWGDALGAVLVAGCLRLTLQWHVTFSVNSAAHLFGKRPFQADSTARDSHWIALVTFGEGYHNFHHRFQGDYRNGVRWFHFDPAKWMIAAFSCVGLASDLRRTPEHVIRGAREKAATSRG